jgi:hypothetical protein
MSPSLPARLPSAGLPRRPPAPRALLAVLCSILTGCLGGQTGTEAAPKNSGGTKSETDTAGTVATGNTNPSNPTASIACSNAPNAVEDLEAQTGMTASAVVDFVHTNNPFLLRYGDGTVTSASVQAVPLAVGCVVPASAGPSALRVPVTLQLTSDDARVNLAFSGVALAYSATAGGVGEVELSGSLQCDQTSGPDAMSPCAIIGIDQAGYARVSIDLSARVQTIAGVTQLLGTLRVAGSPAGTCSPQPCSITDWVSMTSISLSSAQ